MSAPAVRLPNEFGSRQSGYLSLTTFTRHQIEVILRCVTCRIDVDTLTIHLDEMSGRQFGGICEHCLERVTASFSPRDVSTIRDQIRRVLDVGQQDAIIAEAKGRKGGR
jgi:hypothetical protein